MYLICYISFVDKPTAASLNSKIDFHQLRRKPWLISDFLKSLGKYASNRFSISRSIVFRHMLRILTPWVCLSVRSAA